MKENKATVYRYKDSNYLEKPKGTYKIKKEYNAKDGYTLVHLKKDTYWIELICGLILVLCILLRVYTNNDTNTLYFDKHPFYYSNELFLNIDAVALKKPVIIQIKTTDNTIIYEGVLEPGMQIGSIETTNITDELLMVVMREDLFDTKIQSETLFVISR